MGYDFNDAFGQFTLLDTQITTTNSSSVFPEGQIFYWRGGTGRVNTALVRWVKLDNNGCTQGDVLILDDGQTTSAGVKKAGTADAFNPSFRGIAAATIASNSYGFAIIGGYCEKANISKTAASLELLCISASTAGQLTPAKASSFWGATLGLSSTVGTAPFTFALSRSAQATGVASVQIVGMWG